MSQENVEIVRLGFEALNAGEPDFSIFDLALVYHPRTDEPDPSAHVGRDAFERLLVGFLESFRDLRFDVLELIDAGGDRVIVSTTMHGRGAASGASVDDTYVFVYELRDGLVVEGWEYRTRQEALEAAGLSEYAISQENVETALRAIEAWNRRDLAVFIDTWHAEAEWRPAFPKGTEGTGNVFRGHEGIEEAWRNVREAWDEYRVEADDARIVGESLLVLGRIYARGARSGLEIDSDWSAVLRYKDGRAISAWDWLDHAPALRVVGLEE